MGIDDDFEGLFAPECFEITPELDKVFVQFGQMKSCAAALETGASTQSQVIVIL